MTGPRHSAMLLAVVGVLLLGSPALAEERVVTIGRDGVRPQVLRAEPGDTVRFVNEDPTFAYRAQSTGGPWRFDSGPTTLLDGDFVVPTALTASGTYTYRVAQDAPFQGSVEVEAGAPPVPPSPSQSTSAPTPASTPPPASSPPVAAPAVPGPLAGPVSHRALGLALSVAAVLLVGAASLLGRLLLTLPVTPHRPARR